MMGKVFCRRFCPYRPARERLWSKRQRPVVPFVVVAFVFALLGLMFAAGAARAEPTKIVVHVLAEGAKFIGSAVGGAQVTIRDARTGMLLAQG